MHGWQAAAQAVVPTAFGAPAASQERSRGTGVFQAEFPALVTAALPPEAAGKPVEIWFGDRSPCWSARYADTGLGATWHTATGTTGSPLSVGLSVRCRLPRAQDRRSGCHAHSWYRSDE